MASDESVGAARRAGHCIHDVPVHGSSCADCTELSRHLRVRAIVNEKARPTMVPEVPWVERRD